jgi:cyclophilin family peptidyl-prolyl cis-trans isomerase
MKKTFLLGTSLFVGVLLLGAGCSRASNTPATGLDSYSYATDSQTPDPNTATIQPTISNAPAMTIDTTKTYTAVLHTDKGDIEIALATDKTPITANNFITLAQKDFYNGTIFHRVINGFMIQGGDPTGTGAGGPGYKFADEQFDGEYTRGTVAMANAGPNTNGSQFFIMHADYPLPPNYVIFGKLVSGTQTLDAIAEAPVTYNEMREKSKPIDPVKIISIEIEEK